MQTIETNLYSFEELSDDAKATVIANRIKAARNDEWLLQFTSDDLLESLEAVTDACNLRLVDYSFGSYCQGWKVKVRNYDLEDLEGPRALAWFLRILMDHGYARPKHFNDMEFPGICGFTGVCFDDDVVETVWKSLLDGNTVAKAFDQVAYRFCQILEAEYEYLTSEEAVMEYLDETVEIYTEDGEEF